MTLVATPAAPIPDGAVCEWLNAEDGTQLRVARWTPGSAKRGTVVFLNGRTEFIEKYFEVFRDLLARGFAVASLDWRGQGLSDRALANPHKGHVSDFSLFIDDLDHVMQTFVLPTCPGPHVVLSHSMGGNIALRYLSQHPDVFRAACFSAPMFGIGQASRPSRGAKFLASGAAAVGLSTTYVPFAGGDFGPENSRFEGNALTSDRARFERFTAQIEAEPRLALGAPTLGWAQQAIASMDALHEPAFAEAIQTPIRVCSAGEDTLVSTPAQVEISRRLPKAKHVVIEGSRHELLVEVDAYRDRMLGVFDELLDEVAI